jgi:hypothetical protein
MSLFEVRLRSWVQWKGANLVCCAEARRDCPPEVNSDHITEECMEYARARGVAFLET